VGCLLALSLLALPALPAGAAPRSNDAGSHGARLEDQDADRVNDVLERKLRAGERGARHAVVVASDGSVSVTDARGAVGAFKVSRRLGIIGGFSARLTASQIRRLAATPGVVRVDHDATVRITMDAARADYGVDAARAAYGLTGAGVNVCILDTGVDADHEQLDSKTVVWQDFVGTEALPVDPHGHGTHVASIAVGDGTGGAQAATFGGVAPAAGLWAGRVLDETGNGEDSGIIDAIEWCAASPDVDIISMSLGSLLPSDGTDVLSMAANAAVADGKIVVVAAGNSGDGDDTISSPGAASDVVTVGAVSDRSAPGATNHDEGVFLAYFSSRGGETFSGDQKPDIVAPGVTIRAAQAGTATGYVTNSGTSMATPFAAGSLALALQAEPTLTPAAALAALGSTAEDFGPVGKDPDWGAGLIDVLGLTADVQGLSAEHAFPQHVHVSGVVPNSGQFTYDFDLGPEALDVPIAATIVIDGEATCVLDLPPFGCLAYEFSPDLDAELIDPNGLELAISTCAAGTECAIGRQETLHAMPTVAGTYQVRIYPFLGEPTNGLGGAFGMDLSTGPVDDGTPPPPPPPPPPPSTHVRDLDDTSVPLTAKKWRARVAIRVHDGDHEVLAGVVVRGRFGPNGGILTCTTGTGGSCSLQRDLARTRASIVFTVLGLTKSGYAYQSGGNHDPDGDSNGTKITVTRP
jgi:serine protease AprX